MEPRHWKKMVAAIRERYDAYDGFVIAHGTDTMAYTAAALSYMIQNTGKPVVITGAQKPINLEITDAKSNLLDSFRYASDDASQGVVIVFDESEKGAFKKLQCVFEYRLPLSCSHTGRRYYALYPDASLRGGGAVL